MTRLNIVKNVAVWFFFFTVRSRQVTDGVGSRRLAGAAHVNDESQERPRRCQTLTKVTIVITEPDPEAT